jgi:hypothetical protein
MVPQSFDPCYAHLLAVLVLKLPQAIVLVKRHAQADLAVARRLLGICMPQQVVFLVSLPEAAAGRTGAAGDGFL